MNQQIPNEVISASAGTGKTFQLALRYIRLITLGVKPENIVALTFSRKAAGEIFDKIIQRLIEWINDPEARRNQTAAAKMPCFNNEELTRILREILLASHRLRIGTLDSFYVSILRSFPFEFGLCGEFNILDEHLQDELRNEVLAAVLREQDSRTEQNAFLESFRQASFGREEKNLYPHLLAFVEAHHRLYMELPDSDSWGNPQRIWPHGCAAFNNKPEIMLAADALAEKLRNRADISENKKLRWENFFNALPDFNPAATLPQSDPISYILERSLDQLDELGESKVNLPILSKGVELSREEGKMLREILLGILAGIYAVHLARTRGIRSILELYENAYHQRVRRSGRMDFQDIMFLLSPMPGNTDAAILSQHQPGPDRLFIEYRLDGRFDHWLLDEFQDTSFPQWMILHNLIDEVMQDTSERRSFFYVGDIKQAIYGWRGGDARLFSTVYNEFNSRYGNISERPLVKSWRSSAAVIQAVNQVFGELNDGLFEIPKQVTARLNWQEHSTARRELPGYAALYQFAKETDCTETRAAFIEKTIRESAALEQGRSVAVLVRTNKQGSEYASVLRAAGLPATLEGDTAIADNPMVMACMSLIRFAFHPGDEFAWQHLLMTPFAAKFADQESSRADIRSTLCSRLLEQIKHRGFAGLLKKWLDETPQMIGDDPFSKQRRRELLSAARRFDATGNRDGISFCNYINSYKVGGNSRPGAIRIMTIHKSKGLEFDMLFLPELKDKNILKCEIGGIHLHRDDTRYPQWAMLLPKRIFTAADQQLAKELEELDNDYSYEQLCVLYVAMTRARNGLYMLIGEPAAKPTALYPEDLLRQAFAGENATHANTGEKVQTKPDCLWQTGNPQWMHKLKHETIQLPQHKTEPDKFPASMKIISTAGPSAITPSGQERWSVSAADLFCGREDRPMLLGNAVHEIFAEITWTNEINPQEIAVQWQRNSGYPEDVSAEAVEIFINSMQQQELIDALGKTPGANAELWREQPFELRIDDEHISGCFDRVAILRDDNSKPISATIIDYKTDRITPEFTIEKKIDTYTPQLETYRRALTILLSIPPEKISRQLLFVRTGQVVEL